MTHEYLGVWGANDHSAIERYCTAIQPTGPSFVPFKRERLYRPLRPYHRRTAS